MRTLVQACIILLQCNRFRLDDQALEQHLERVHPVPGLQQHEIEDPSKAIGGVGKGSLENIVAGVRTMTGAHNSRGTAC